jgi:hypothetical protein
MCTIVGKKDIPTIEKETKIPSFAKISFIRCFDMN